MKNKAPYLPMSDCECYMEALELVEQAMEDYEKYIYLNDWLANNACNGYPQSQEDLADLVRDGKKLLYFSSQSGNLYISNGYIDDSGSYPIIYFSLFPECDDENRSKSGAWLGAEFAFYPNDNYMGSMKYVLLNVDADMSSEVSRGFVVPNNAVGILKDVSGMTINDKYLNYFYSNGNFPVVALNTVDFSSFLTIGFSSNDYHDGDTLNFKYNSRTWSNHSTHPYIRITKQQVGSIVFDCLVVIDET